MIHLELFSSFMLLTQITNSLEEVFTRFDQRWTFMHKVGFKFMVYFLIVFNFFWIMVSFDKIFIYRDFLLILFLVLITALLEIVIFLMFYFAL